MAKITGITLEDEFQEKIKNSKYHDFITKLLKEMYDFHNMYIYYTTPNGKSEISVFNSSTLTELAEVLEMTMKETFLDIPLSAIDFVLKDGDKTIGNYTKETERQRSIDWINLGKSADDINKKYLNDKNFVLKVIEKNPSFLNDTNDRIKKDKEFILKRLIYKNKECLFYCHNENYQDFDFCKSVIKETDDEKILAHLCNNCNKKDLKNIFSLTK